MFKKSNKRFFMIAALTCCVTVGLACTALAADKGDPLPAYAKVNITNRTSYHATGEVLYLGAELFCKNDKYSVNPGAKWEHSRGACLISVIEATISGDGKTQRCKPYNSTGTSYATFQIVGDMNKCEVIRP